MFRAGLIPIRITGRTRTPRRPPGHAGKPVPVSATILTQNSAARLSEVLDSLRWCDEIVVLDTGSADGTCAIAARCARAVLHRLSGPFPGFGRAHRLAVALASNDWILSVDSDEIVTPALAVEITTLSLNPHCVYSIPFENYLNRRHITTCGWWPDRHERLFNRTVTNFCESDVHERVNTKGLSVRKLRQPICHYSYESFDDFLRKMRSYSRLFAIQNARRKPSGPFKAILRGTWAFLKSYFLQRGFLQGAEGLVISAYKAQTTFWKYLMLYEANRRLPSA